MMTSPVLEPAHGGFSGPHDGATAPDAIELLTEQHRQILELFDDYENADSLLARQAVANRLCESLALHERLKEEVFYPVFVAAVGDPWMRDAALAEHADARGLLVQIQASDTMHGEEYDALVRALAALFRRQCEEEEKAGGMFEQLGLAGVDLYALGEQLEQRRTEIQARRAAALA